MSSANCTISNIYSSGPSIGVWSTTAGNGRILAGNVNITMGNATDGYYSDKQNWRTKLIFTLPDVNITTTNKLILTVPLNSDSYPYPMKACLATNDVSAVGSVLNSSGSEIDTNNVSALAYSLSYRDSSGNRYYNQWSSNNGNSAVYFIFDLSGISLSKNTNYYIYIYRTVTSLDTACCIYGSTAGKDAYTLSLDYTYTPPTYTISYNANGGTGAPPAQTKTYNVALTLSSTKPTKANTVTYPTGTITISYNANGGSSTPNNGTGQYINTKTVPYTFKNWNTNSAGTGTSYNAGASYTANAAATLYAQWNTGSATETRTTNPNITMASAITRANGSTTGYTVTFNVNGGSSSHNAVTSTRTITYTFGGWNTNSNGTGTNYSASTAYEFSENNTLYAKWTPSYTNNAITLPTPTRSGYKFLGWATTSTASSGTTGSYTPSSNITLYAIWEALATMFIKVSNTYKAGAPYVKVNNTWKKAIGVYVKVGNQWKLSTR